MFCMGGNLDLSWYALNTFLCHLCLICEINTESCDNVDILSTESLTFCKINLGRNINFNGGIPLKFCTEHSSVTAVLCAKFQKDSPVKTEVTHKWDFARFQLKMDVGGENCLHCNQSLVTGISTMPALHAFVGLPGLAPTKKIRVVLHHLSNIWFHPSINALRSRGGGGGYSLCDGWYICAAVLTPFFHFGRIEHDLFGVFFLIHQHQNDLLGY